VASPLKLYQLDALAPGASDRFYLTRADGSEDGSCSFTEAISVLTGILGGTFAASSHTHTLSQITDAGTMAAQAASAVAITGGTIVGITDLAVADGGTGASTGGAALSNFGLTANGVSLVTAANYSAMRTLLTLVPGTDVQAFSSVLSTYAGITPSANVQTLLGAANFAAFRTSLSIGAIGLLSTVTEADITLADNTTNNVTSTKHGYTPKSPADATKFLNGAATPAFALVKDSDLSTSDITTNDVSTTKHGFAPKLPNDAAKYLDGTGTFSVPAGAGGGSITVKEEGSNLTTALTSIDLVGGGVTGTNSTGAVTVTVRDYYVHRLVTSTTDGSDLSWATTTSYVTKGNVTFGLDLDTFLPTHYRFYIANGNTTSGTITLQLTTTGGTAQHTGGNDFAMVGGSGNRSSGWVSFDNPGALTGFQEFTLAFKASAGTPSLTFRGLELHFKR
jgi:hypothetical protein